MNGHDVDMLVASGKSLDRLTPAQREITRSLASAFGAAGEELYLVGGIVRDALLGRAMLADLDFATSAAPPRTRELLESAGATSVYLVGERFGTIGAVFGQDAEPVAGRSDHIPARNLSGRKSVPGGRL